MWYLQELITTTYKTMKSQNLTVSVSGVGEDFSSVGGRLRLSFERSGWGRGLPRLKLVQRNN